MKPKHPFIPLVRHELSVWKRRRKSGGPISKTWFLVYAVLILALMLIFSTWMALKHSFQLESAWYITFALPYI
ncbi:MAG TPA: hypothetical protein VFK27_03500, partial [Bacillales bacterium]|nr:hypothetical protein [Bacillales bacterium]